MGQLRCRRGSHGWSSWSISRLAPPSTAGRKEEICPRPDIVRGGGKNFVLKYVISYRHYSMSMLAKNLVSPLFEKQYEH